MGRRTACKALRITDADLLHKVAGLCNNANQLARVANTYGEAGPQSIEEMTKLARQVWEEVKENW